MEEIGIGAMLGRVRAKWGLSLREVEERSRVLARRWDRPKDYISDSWLYRVERSQGDLSATKLLLLAAIYGLTVDDMLAACRRPASLPFADTLGPNKTIPLPKGHLDEGIKNLTPEKIVTEAPPVQTELLPTPEAALPSQYRRAVVGHGDGFLSPMIPPGSILLIDTSQRTIDRHARWTNEFDRPLYFVLTRDGYASAFCELDADSEWLTLVPHMLSHAPNRRLRYRREVDIIGTITAVFAKRGAHS